MMEEDRDIDRMADAFAALTAIPVDSGRRQAALDWVHARIQTDIKHELDRRSVQYVGTALAIEAQNGKTKGLTAS